MYKIGYRLENIERLLTRLYRRKTKVVTVDSDYLISSNDDIILVDSTNGDIDVSLPLASKVNKAITIKKISSSNSVNILTQNSEEIDNTTPPSLANLSSLVLVSNGINWFIL